MTTAIDNLERSRLRIQANLDQQKSSSERNKLGQFATPTALARDILTYGVSLLNPADKINFLDPAIGTGSFYSALQEVCPNGRVAKATGFEIDPHYGLPAAKLWRNTKLNYALADFTRQSGEPNYNLIICNPPYVRHHHLSSEYKERLQHQTYQAADLKLSGLAGLYCYFMGLAHAWMARNAVAGWLIPSEFMDVNYGAALKQYLLDKVTLLHIHRFDPNDVQFADALVSSAIVWFRNTPPPKTSKLKQSIKFTYGGSLESPEVSRSIPAAVLRDEMKWTRFPLEETRVVSDAPNLGDIFKIKRGIATGANKFFILSEADVHRKEIPPCAVRPILPSPRYISEDVIESDEQGNPILDRRLFLLDTRMSEAQIKREHPSLWAYLEQGRADGVHEGYICRHRPLWYSQDQRPPAPIVCTYLGRGSKESPRPFRFIRNRSCATVANVYLAMYPTLSLQREVQSDPKLMERLWKMLNQLDIASILGEARIYGGGLHKLEPSELARVPLTHSRKVLPDRLTATVREQCLF